MSKARRREWAMALILGVEAWYSEICVDERGSRKRYFLVSMGIGDLV
jgi:hypothetical protein